MFLWRMFRRLTVIVMLMLATLPRLASADTLTGIVLDANGGERLARVQVRIERLNRQTTTNADGRFAFQDLPSGDYVMIVETVGYRLRRQRVTVPADVSVPLTPDTGGITETVTVTADPFVRAVAASPSQTTLPGNDIRNLSGVLVDDPMRALSNLPGVSVPNDYYASFSVRGAPFSQVGIYLDDVRVRAPMHGFGGAFDGYSISALNDQVLADMTLIPTALTPAYADTIGAAVVANTRDGSRVKPSFRASVGMSDVNALGEGPLAGDRGSWLFAARKSYLGNVIRRLGGNAAEVLAFDDVQGKLTLDLTPRSTLSMHLLAGDTSYKSGADDLTVGPDTPFGSSGANSLFTLNWRYTPTDRIVLNATGAYARDRFDVESQSVSALAASHYTELTTQGSVAWFWHANDPLRAGYSTHRFSDHGVSSAALFESPTLHSLNAYRGTAIVQNAFAQQEWSALDAKVHLAAGLRWQRHDGIASSPILPYGSMSVQLSPASRLDFGYGQYAQFPELDQIALSTLGSPLKPQRATHYVAGFERKLDAQTRIRIEAFDRETRDLLDMPTIYPGLIDGRVTWPSSLPRWSNGLRGYSRGVEVVLQRRSASRLTGSIGYTLTYSRWRDGINGSSFWSDNDQRHIINLYASYRLTPSLNLSGRVSYASGAPVPGYFREVAESPDLEYALSSDRNGSRLPSYQRIDVRLNKSFAYAGWKLTLYTEVINATNHRNLRFMGVGGNYTDQAWPRIGSTVSLLPSVGFSVDF
jgi:hypothetical protein